MDIYKCIICGATEEQPEEVAASCGYECPNCFEKMVIEPVKIKQSEQETKC